MSFDSNVAKYELHNVGYDTNTKSLKSFPTCRVKYDDDNIICVSLHKWTVDPDYDKNNRGLYIALYKITKESNVDKDQCKRKLDELKVKCNDSFIKLIESGKIDDSIYVFKFSINCWRPVIKKCKKWTYVGEKPEKESECLIQRLINE